MPAGWCRLLCRLGRFCLGSRLGSRPRCRSREISNRNCNSTRRRARFGLIMQAATTTLHLLPLMLLLCCCSAAASAPEGREHLCLLCPSLFVNSAPLRGSDPSRIIYSHEGCGRNTRSVRHHTPPHVVLQHPSGSRICNQVSHIGTRACLPGLLASALFPCLRLCTPQTTTAWLGAKAQLFRSTRLLHPANNLSQVCTSTMAATLPSENNFATSWPTSSWPLTQPCCMSKHLADWSSH